MSLFELMEKWGLDALKETKDETKNSIFLTYSYLEFGRSLKLDTNQFYFGPSGRYKGPGMAP